MKTGFYKLNGLSEEQLKQFFTDAVMLSYDSHVEKLESWQRENTDEKSIGQMISNVSKENHNVCIDRSIQMQNRLVGEVAYSTFGSPSYFLYCFLTLDNLKILTDKYSLNME